MQISSFGCSFVFGSDLSDASAQHQYHSWSTWPALLAKKLQWQYTCLARPGIGNLQIAERILSSFADTPPSLYIISWTWIDRFDYVDQPDPNAPLLDPVGWRTLLPTMQNEAAHVYYKKLHSQLKDKITTLIYIKTVIDSLKEKEIPFLMTYMDDLIFEKEPNDTAAVVNLQNYVAPYLKNFNGKNFLDWSIDNKFAISDTMHPLEQAHESAADYIFKNLTHWVVD